MPNLPDPEQLRLAATAIEDAMQMAKRVCSGGQQPPAQPATSSAFPQQSTTSSTSNTTPSAPPVAPVSSASNTSFNKDGLWWIVTALLAVVLGTLLAMHAYNDQRHAGGVSINSVTEAISKALDPLTKRIEKLEAKQVAPVATPLPATPPTQKPHKKATATTTPTPEQSKVVFISSAEPPKVMTLPHGSTVVVTTPSTPLAVSASSASASAQATGPGASAEARASVPTTPSAGKICRLASDGSARLKAVPASVLPRDTVIAQSQDDGRVPQGAKVININAGEDCNIWRRRVEALLVAGH